MDAKTNVIKLRFSGQPLGKEYTYFTPVDVEVGDLVEIAGIDGPTTGVVTEVNVAASEIAPFAGRAKGIIGKAKRD